MHEVVVAMVSGLCVAIPSLVTTFVTNHHNYKLITYQITELQKQVEKHNTFDRRIVALETEIKIIKDKIK